jgi:hypothetical protein
MAAVALAVGVVHARDLGVLVLPIHEGKITTSLLYEHLKVQDDFDARGRADFTAQASGAQVSYGITDQLAISVKGGVLLDPQEDAQGSQWQSRAGTLYGIDLYNEVFPATPGWRPGIQVSGGVTGFQVPLDRTNSVTGSWQTIDQMMSGIEYHGAVLATFKAWKAEPYAGVRGFGSHVTWQDNQTNPGVISGHAHGNISLVVGLPVQILKDVRLEAEGRFVNETAVTAGFTVAVF